MVQNTENVTAGKSKTDAHRESLMAATEEAIESLEYEVEVVKSRATQLLEWSRQHPLAAGGIVATAIGGAALTIAGALAARERDRNWRRQLTKRARSYGRTGETLAKRIIDAAAIALAGSTARKLGDRLMSRIG